jgi:aryl-alcohol dehydrogenase-like predicted oxidoreductase
MQRIELSPGYEISRVIRGGWQMASGHGALRSDDPIADLVAFADAGITTFDCADIYTGVEELIGRFREKYRDMRGAEALRRIKVHTKFVPDLDVLPRISKANVESVIDQSLRRLNLERLDLVQFHWWDYAHPRWLDAAVWLNELRLAGKIDKVSATNFDTDRMLAMIEAGVPLASMQLQYSLLDSRPEKRLVEAAARHGVWLFCYGTVAGGFLGDRWLGAAEPNDTLENRSLIKYRLIIDDLGGWDWFQDLLTTLRGIADGHDVDIATIASAAMLGRRQVAAVIVGARNRTHLASNLAVSGVSLTASDHIRIAEVLGRAKRLDGDVYTLERDRHGRHGSIMKYNLNKGAA